MSDSSNSTTNTLSSPKSSLHSYPTSDEQPDLGFNQLLREYSHLQPQPRIPIQIRSQTSSTTPTYHTQSVTTHRTQSSLSTFTRPPTSTLEPDGETVWDHPFIAPYLPSSNDDELDDDYSASESLSRASTSLTVEISDLRSFNNDDHSPFAFSPEPTSAVAIVDSLAETPQTEVDIDFSSSHPHSDDSPTSIQLQSQVIPVASASSLSLASSDEAGVTVSIAAFSGPSSINSRIDGTLGRPTSSESTSTLMNVFLNRSRNPIPPRTASDSSYSTTTRTSSFSLISYQLPESPSVPDLSESEQPFPHLRLQPSSSISSPSTTTLPTSSSAFLAAQRSFNSHSNLSVPGTDATLPNPHSLPAPSPLTNPHSLSAPSPLTNPHSLPAASPTLTNPYSFVTTPDAALRHLMPNESPRSRQVAVVDDLDTPYNPPSESILYDPSRRIFEPIRDDESEPRRRFLDQSFGSYAFFFVVVVVSTSI